ncbi:MAG: ROK family protein [Anaerolineae bacterium]
MTRYAIGVDIGGTKIAAGLVSEEGAVTAYRVAPTPVSAGASAILSAALDLSRRVAAEGQGLDITCIGIGSAGEVDVARGVVTYASDNLPGWSGLALAEAFERAVGLPAVADNDVNALAIGESRFGAGRGLRDVLYVAVGTGIGGAVMLDGRLRRGVHWAAGEIGHLIADWDGDRVCSCGCRGHLEAYASGPALAARYRELTLEEGQTSNVSGQQERAALDLRAVAARAAAGDALARRVIAEGAEILGICLGGLLDALDTEALIIGGGVAELGELWWRPLERALRNNPLPGPAQVILRPAQLAAQGVLIGAAWLALTRDT